MGEEYKRTVSTEGLVSVSPNIILHDDIEGSFKWSGSGTGADWVVDKYAGTVQVNNGSYCLRMKTRTTTPAVGDYVGAYKYTTLRRWEVVKFSMFFYPATQAGYKLIRIANHYATGSEEIYGYLQWYRPTQMWQYYNTAGVWEDIPGSNQSLYGDAYHYFSYVINYDKKEITQLQCDSLLLDNLHLKGYFSPSTATPKLYTSIWIISNTTSPQILYLDDISLTEAA